MEFISIDMDPSSGSSNTSSSLGTRQSCARINENGVIDADEDAVDVDGDTDPDPDVLVLDVTASGVPSTNPMVRVRVRAHLSAREASN
jgi:hypothetical protein